MARPEKGPNRPDETGVYFLNETKIARKYTQIPKDQQDLLSRPESWNLKGTPNMPAHLLKDVKGAHIRSYKQPTQATPPRTVPSGAPNGRFSKGAIATASRCESQSAGESESVEKEEEEDANSQFSWAPSPEAHKLPQQRATVDEMTLITTPRDQKALLREAQSWDRKGIPKIPAQLLKDAENARNLRSQKPTHSTPSRVVSSGASNSASSKRPSASRPRFDSQPADELEDNEDDSDDADEISWMPSSGIHKLPQTRASLERLPPMPTPTPIYGNQASSPNTGRLAARAVTNTRYRTILSAQNPPSSSLGSEPDIEYQPPLAITDVVVDPVARVRQAAKAAATPPSAQIVPCTWKEKSSPRRPEAMEQPEPKRRRRMKELKFDSSQPVTQGVTQVVNETVFTQASNSTAGSSTPSQVPPAKVSYGLREPVQHGQAVFNPNGKTAPSSAAPFPRHSDGKRNDAVDKDHAVSLSNATGQRAPPKAVDQQTSSNSEAIPPNGPASQAPFTAFCVAYPDFAKYDRSGLKPASIGVFVSAVVAIEALQHLRQLPEFLYDDFIRVFCKDFLVYIDEWYSVPRKGQPLTAIQWYNENVPEPIYTKKVMNRHTLRDVGKAYPEKYAAARDILSKNSSSGGASADKSSPVPSEGGTPAPGPEPPVRQTPGSEPVISTALSQPGQSSIRSIGPPGQTVRFQDDPRYAARDSSLPSEGRCSPTPEHTPKVVSTVRLQTVSAYVAMIYQPEEDSKNQDLCQNAVPMPGEVPVKEEEFPAPIEQIALVHDLSQPASGFETQAFQTQAFNASLGQPGSTSPESQGFDAPPAATSTARSETRVITRTQEQVSSTMSETQDFETQAPMAASTTIEHDISRIPETAIKPKTTRRATLGTQVPPSSHVPEPVKGGSRLSLGSKGPQYTAAVDILGGGPEISRRIHKPGSTTGDKHVTAGRRLHSQLVENITKQAGHANITTTASPSPTDDKPRTGAQQPGGGQAYTVIKGGPPMSSGRRRTSLASPRASLGSAGQRAPTSSRAPSWTKIRAQRFEEYCARMKMGTQGSADPSSARGR